MKEIDDNMLTEFLEGKLDEPANREIENWYDASEENRRRLEALYFVLLRRRPAPVPPHRSTPSQAFRSLQRRIELQPHEKQGPNGGDRGALRRHPPSRA